MAESVMNKVFQPSGSAAVYFVIAGGLCRDGLDRRWQRTVVNYITNLLYKTFLAL